MNNPVSVTPTMFVGTGTHPYNAASITKVDDPEEAVRLIRQNRLVQVPNLATARRVLENLGVDNDWIEHLLGRIVVPDEPATAHHSSPTLLPRDATPDELADFVTQVKATATAHTRQPEAADHDHA